MDEQNRWYFAAANGIGSSSGTSTSALGSGLSRYGTRVSNHTTSTTTTTAASAAGKKASSAAAAVASAAGTPNAHHNARTGTPDNTAAGAAAGNNFSPAPQRQQTHGPVVAGADDDDDDDSNARDEVVYGGRSPNHPFQQQQQKQQHKCSPAASATAAAVAAPSSGSYLNVANNGVFLAGGGNDLTNLKIHKQSMPTTFMDALNYKDFVEKTIEETHDDDDQYTTCMRQQGYGVSFPVAGTIATDDSNINRKRTPFAINTIRGGAEMDGFGLFGNAEGVTAAGTSSSSRGGEGGGMPRSYSDPAVIKDFVEFEKRLGN